MKSLIVAVGLLAATATTAAAQFAPPPWARDSHPYAQRHHRVCQDKAFRLHDFERRAARDGHVSFRERRIMRELRYDLDRTCGRFRWRG